MATTASPSKIRGTNSAPVEANHQPEPKSNKTIAASSGQFQLRAFSSIGAYLRVTLSIHVSA